MRAWLQLVVGLLPASRLKNLLLTWSSPSFRVDPTARISPIVLWRVGELKVGPEAAISWLAVFRDVRSCRIGTHATIGNGTMITGVSQRHSDDDAPHRGSVRLARYAVIANWHRVDCGGGFLLGEWSALAGSGTTILTHSYDIMLAAQHTAPIVVGDFCFIGSGSLLLPGVTLTDRVVVASRGVVTQPLEESDTLYAGVPCRAVKKIPEARYFQSGARLQARLGPEISDLDE